MSEICGLKHVIFNNVNVSEDGITARAMDARRTSKCPCCGKRSSSVHSFYSRSVSTLPIHGKKVEITAIVRRFRCRNPKCVKAVFTAQIEGLTERYSRRSVSARGFLREFLVPVPATVGARQATASGIPISASTALRIVYGAEPRIDYGSIKRICIDDFACRKGQTYRTLIADADTGLPVEIIGSRDESDVAKALKKYKKVSVVSRDRAGAYSKAISKARPRARQVADRFHLVKNCGDHVKEALRNNQLAIRKEVERHAQTPPASKASSLFHPPTPEDIGLFNKARELRSKGRSLESIARELGSSRRRITGICNSDAPHGRKVTTPKMILPYLDAIEKGIAAGKGYKRILADILESGGSMSLEALTRGMNKLYPLYRPRRGDPSTAEKKNLVMAKEQAKDPANFLSSGRLHIYLMNPDYGIDKKTGKCTLEHILAEKVVNASNMLLQLRECHTSFRNILSGDSTEALDEWIKKYSRTTCKDMASFAKSVIKDIRPIKNAIRYSISNGLIEGLNNKIKALKRSMYGRASDKLLWIKMYRTGIMKLQQI